MRARTFWIQQPCLSKGASVMRGFLVMRGFSRLVSFLGKTVLTLGVALVGLLTLAGTICSITGYTLKDLAEPKNATFAGQATRWIAAQAIQPIPRWWAFAPWLV